MSNDKAPCVCPCFCTHYIYWGICWLYVRLPVKILIDFHWSSRQPYIIEVFFLKVKICNIMLFVHNKKHYCINFFKETHNSYFCVTFRFISLHHVFSNNSKNINNMHIWLTRIDHCNSRLSNNINLTKNNDPFI